MSENGSVASSNAAPIAHLFPYTSVLCDLSFHNFHNNVAQVATRKHYFSDDNWDRRFPSTNNYNRAYALQRQHTNSTTTCNHPRAVRGICPEGYQLAIYIYICNEKLEANDTSTEKKRIGHTLREDESQHMCNSCIHWVEDQLYQYLPNLRRHFQEARKLQISKNIAFNTAFNKVGNQIYRDNAAQ